MDIYIYIILMFSVMSQYMLFKKQYEERSKQQNQSYFYNLIY